MKPELYLRLAVDPALTLLPPEMTSPEARATVTAIALQESRLEQRYQIGGPARGFTQFEIAGIRGVLAHRASIAHAQHLCLLLRVTPDTPAVYDAVAQNDILCAGFARLLLWTLPQRLPRRDEEALGWEQYLAAWRPGKPHPETWGPLFRQAWRAVDTVDEGRS